MKSREVVEGMLEKTMKDADSLPTEALPAVAGVIVGYALLYIGDVLNKHLSAIAKNTKPLKDIAKRVKK